MLAVMGPERLARSLFPLGDVVSKEETRREAAARGLSVSAKPDSYDICFVADGDTQGFLRSRLGSQPGEIVDESGAVLGTHDGAYAYTVGQRRGLSIGRPGRRTGSRGTCSSVEPVNNRVVVGSADDLAVDVVLADRAVWFAPPSPVVRVLPAGARARRRGPAHAPRCCRTARCPSPSTVPCAASRPGSPRCSTTAPACSARRP